MNKNFTLDYLAYKLACFLGALFSLFPPESCVWLGKIFGRMMFYLDRKHRDIVYRNIRFVFHRTKPPSQLRRIAKLAFENFGQNLFETLSLRRIDKAYINKYVEIEGRYLKDKALSNKKGLIYLTLHLGNWELANAACGLTHESCSVIVKHQKHTRLNELLNSYRRNFGVKIVDLNSLRDIVRALENNEIVTMVSDHGAGEGDTFIDFFQRPAPMPPGAVRLALKFKVPLLFAYIVRVGGPYHKIIVESFDSFSDTGDKDKDLEVNLRSINRRLEGYIRNYPEQYLWSYKRWKHSKQRSILILSDGKTGHLRQSETVAKIIKDLGFNLETKIIEIKFRNRLRRLLLLFYAKIAGSSMSCLKHVLAKDSYDELVNSFADIVVSAGSSTASVNLITSYENKAKSIHIMRPSVYSVRRFNLVIMPKHDNPPKYRNVAVTNGALNLIDVGYLKEQSERLCSAFEKLKSPDLKIGLLLGGDTKDYKLTEDMARKIINRIKRISLDLNLEILVTTSRRTPKKVEEILKRELADFPRCRLLIIANEKNIPEAVGGILGLCSVVIVTAESISMISEAATSGKFVIVVDVPVRAEAIPSEISRRHRNFLGNLKEQRYIYIADADTVGYTIKEVLTKRPAIRILKDRVRAREKIEKIL